jgi:cytochrome d ubiquinol oxidase subunit II
VGASRFAGGPFDWVGLFPAAIGLGVVAGYALLGACWLIWRTDGTTQVFARQIARPALLATGVAIGLVSVWTPLAVGSVWERWFGWPGILLLVPLPLLAVSAWVGAWRTLWSDRDYRPFLYACGLVVTALIGLGISIWPDAIPGVLPLALSGSAPRTQAIVAGVLVCILPIILSYVGFAYWVFRGKVRLDEPETTPTGGIPAP